MKKRTLKGTREANTMMALVMVTAAQLTDPQAHADITLNGTATINAAETHNNVILGGANPGTLNVTSAGVLNTRSLIVGNRAEGLLNVDGGIVNVREVTDLGVVGKGTINVTNSGTLNTDFIAVGLAGEGLLNVNGGFVNVTRDANFYSSGAKGSAVVASGTLAIGGDLILGGASGTGLNTLDINSGGLVRVSGDLTRGGAGSVINLNIGGTLQIGTGGTAGKLLGGSGNLTNNGTLIFNHSNSLSYDGVLSGSGALGKQGTGALRITGANTYTGATTISGGILNLRSATGLGTTAGSTTVSNGATLQLAGAISVGAEALSLNGGAASGQTGALVNEGGKNTYGGAVTVTASSSISAATGSELSLTGGVVNNGTVATFNGGGTINVNTVAISGSSANSDLVIDGVTVNLGVSSTYNGSTFIRNSGTLNANVTNALPTAHGRTAVTFDGTGTAVLTLGAAQSVASLTSAGAATVTLGANTLRVGTSTGSTTFAGIIGGTGGLIKDDASTQTLSGANTYTGATTISAGILNLRNATGLGTTAGRTTVSNGATLQLQDGITVGAEGLSLNGGAASGQTGALVNVSGTNTYGGAVTVTASSSISAASGSVLNLTGGVVKNGTVATFNGGGTINVNTVAISGSSANSDLVIDGATVNLGVANTYNGPTVIRNGGTLNANVTDALPTANGRSAVIMDDTGTGNSSLSLVASQLIASLTGAADSLVSLLTGTYLTVGHSTGDATFTGVISGSGGLIKDRASTQTLTGANFYTGGTTLNGGTLKLSGALGALTATSAVNINGGTLLLSGLAANQISDTAPISLGAATDSMLQLSGAVTETLGAMTLAGGAGARVIDFGATSGVLTFASLSADSSLPLQIWNWSGTFRAGGGTDQLIVSNGTFGGSLAESDISFFTDSGVNRIAGTTGFTANNELVPVPEASTLLGVLGLLAPLAWRERRHWMRCREARG